MASRAPCQRDVLETLERALLVRLLAPHTAWLEAHGVSLRALAEAAHDADADGPLRALYALLSRRDAPAPPLLTEALRDLDALASPAGHDALLRAARDRATLLAADRTAASQAAALLLDHPDVFAAARVVASCEGIARYVELAPRSPDALDRTARAASPESLAASLSAELSPWFAERGRTRYVDVLVLPDDAELMIEITHGDVPRAHSELDASLRRAPRLARRTRRDLALLDRRSGHLALAACSVAERDVFRRAFGAVVLGDAEGFALRPLLDLAPLLEPLLPGLGVLAAEVVEAQLERPDRPRALLSHPSGLGAYFASAEGRAVTEGARVARAVLSLSIQGRKRPLRVELATPSSVRVDRRDRAVEETARAWLLSRGVMTTTGSRPRREHAVTRVREAG